MVGFKQKISAWFSPHDMTHGKPYKRILEFALPMLVGNIAQQLYNTADSIIVGRYVGDLALAAVGSAMPVLMLLLALFVGISTGAGILVAQSFGAKDREKLSLVIGNCLILTVLASGVIMVLGALITRPLLLLMQTPNSIINWCAEYLGIFFIGIAGFFFYNILSGILRGLGDSLSSLGFLLVATILNIVLDLVFVINFNMGVAGVALATVLAQGFSAVLCLWRLACLRAVFDLKVKYLRIKKACVYNIVRIGVPSGITQAVFSLAMLVVQSLTNSLGEMVIACNVIVMRVDGFAMMPNFTFAQAISTFTAQNVGANRTDRLHKGAKQGLLMAVATSTILTILIVVFGKYLVEIFTQTQELIDMSVNMLRLLAVGYIAMSVTQSLTGVMSGSGNTTTPMLISIFTTVALRIPVAYGIAFLTRSADYPNGAPESVFFSLLISWICGAVITSIVFKMGKWKKRSRITQ